MITSKGLFMENTMVIISSICPCSHYSKEGERENNSSNLENASFFGKVEKEGTSNRRPAQSDKIGKKNAFLRFIFSYSKTRFYMYTFFNY